MRLPSYALRNRYPLTSRVGLGWSAISYPPSNQAKPTITPNQLTNVNSRDTCSVGFSLRQ